ncbi:hypothetical protein LVB77_15365 [Lysobacter sp. 5GHs7-4]|uniref:hypothetical protein n=1 Tax=Lysobacter sp. 5GHs7-4 TaxID=2904253 RepID=UPI001E465AE1|nr:hypothetical protein [Lysobacter sp. 5GHs7-4]UHQ22040.1 hypothetical protein LVB77_15365 [Lysobacter sp. 5GHs7-4]
MKLTFCLLLAFIALSSVPTPVDAATQPLLLCPIGQKATPVRDAEGKVVGWVCTKR